MIPLALRVNLRFRLEPAAVAPSSREGAREPGGGVEAREGTGRREILDLLLDDIREFILSAGNCSVSFPSDEVSCGSGSSSISGTDGS